MEKNRQNVTINIHGGNNQILPNATHAVQYFYGEKQVKENDADEAEEQSSSSSKVSIEESVREEDVKRLSLYIPESESLLYYIEKLKVCATASDLAKVVMEICQSPEIESVDKEGVVKAKFIETLLALCPKITKGNSISNIRARINDLLTRR